MLFESSFSVWNEEEIAVLGLQSIAWSLYPHAFPVEIEHFEDRIFVCGLVEADVTYFLQQGEIDDAGTVLLVVLHQFIELVILLAVEGKDTVMFFDELDGLPNFFFRSRAPCSP